MSTSDIIVLSLPPDWVPSDTTTEVQLSVIVPVTERPEPLTELYREFAAPLRESGRAFEFLFIVEPWTRSLAEPLAALATHGEPVRVLEVGQSVGEAALLRLGAAHARGSVVLTLPSYRRIEAAALPRLVDEVERGADLAVARRFPRLDSGINRLHNRVLHAVIGGLAAGRINDVACGVRAMRRELLEELPIYGDFFRFIPLFAVRDGYDVREIDAPQHPADVGPRFYGPGTYLRRLVDVLGLFFLLRFTEKPLRFFGLIGSAFATSGALLLLFLLIERLGGEGIAERPLLLLSVLLLVLGVQAIALGLVGEIIVHLNAPSRRPYRVASPRMVPPET
jgi:hypothetical protein